MWRILAEDPVTGEQTFGIRQNADNGDFFPVSIDAAGEAFTEIAPGVYEYTFFHFENTGYQIVATNGVTTTNSGLTTVDIAAACDAVPEEYDGRLDDLLRLRRRIRSTD